jgi:hypothetical protein
VAPHHDSEASGHGGPGAGGEGHIGGAEQVRQSRLDSQVLLFYRAEGTSRWVCAVAKRAADQGFLITAYPTDAIKEGTQVWPK